ncbi:MAG: dihydroorotate dehydrogenase [Desulfobacterota bacterium]|jgi:dihydroorotate dehydrogenase (NAD+) catalytic subunit|nr:dihydroorotate dehydrogenase [Thermodesulfobacteriota bacterium]
MSGLPDRSVTLGRLQLKNPVMPAAGTFGYAEEYSNFLDLDRLGAIVVKTITLKSRVGSYPHRSTETASGFLASIGLQNVGIERFLQDKLPFFERLKTPLIVNIGGESVEEYVSLAKSLDPQAAVRGLELNVSCPNVRKGGMHFGVDPEVLRDLVSRVRQVTGKMVTVKLTPMVTDIRPFAEICQRQGADAVSVINAPIGMAVDIKTRRSRLGKNMTGGLAGPAIKPIALYCVWQVCRTVDLPVIGIGGIASLEDALEFFIAGACAVQVGTWNFINPRITLDIIEGLEKYMAEHQIKSLSEIQMSKSGRAGDT